MKRVINEEILFHHLNKKAEMGFISLTDVKQIIQQYGIAISQEEYERLAWGREPVKTEPKPQSVGGALVRQMINSYQKNGHF